MRRMLAAVAGLIMAGVMPGAAADWPTKPVTLIIPFAPGGATDGMGRILAQELSTALGQQVIVENHPGAAGTVGLTTLMKAPGDGYTLAFTPMVPSIENAVIDNPPYKLTEDFSSVAQVLYVPVALFANAKEPFNNLSELVEEAKKNPGKLNAYSVGVGSHSHFTLEQFMKLEGVDIEHIPYEGGAPAVAALVAGEVDMGFDAFSIPQKFVATGELKALGVASEKRVPFAPNVPTFAEQGVPNFLVSAWYGIYGPKGLPGDVSTRIYTELQKIMVKPEIAKKLDTLAMVAELGDAAVMKKRLETEISGFRRTAQEAGIEFRK